MSALADPPSAGVLFTGARSVAVFEEDPELLAGLSPEDAATLAPARVPLLAADAGDWAAPHEAHGRIGLLLLEGLLVRTVRVGRRESVELLGPGDLLRPWSEDRGELVVPSLRWEAITPLRFAELDARFALTAGRRPALLQAVLERTVERSRWLTVRSSLVAHPLVEDRLLLLFAHLAERHGKVTAEGVKIPLQLMHRWLAALVGSRRPSATSALSRLARKGQLCPVAPEGWLLTHAGLAHVRALCADGAYDLD